MPLSLSVESDILPENLRGIIETNVYGDLVREIKHQRSNGQLFGFLFCCGCTLLLGIIGLLIGLCLFYEISTSLSNDKCSDACAQYNRMYFGGRRIFEWSAQDGKLLVFPENRFDTVVTMQPGVGTVIPVSQVFVQQPQFYVPPNVQGQQPPQAYYNPPVVVIDNSQVYGEPPASK